jgi:TetR/AcrR family transcriptional regulator
MSRTGASRRDQILDAATACFARYGYRRTSMDALARAAGMSRPAVYQYFTGKEEVFRAMGVRLLDSALTRAEQARHTSEPVADRISAVLTVRVDLHRGNGDGRELQRELTAEIAEVAGDLLASFQVRLIAILESLLRTARTELDFTGSAVTTHDVAVILLDAVTGIEQETGSIELLRTRVRQLVGLVVRALAARQ